ncbi:hypothetical protein QBC36DRAFT_302800 [Triangularia setosa]|uniref:Uncharacterized protein n=1 Tax=Triangularia setosa TaxID=2587417 RepID=A0AAN6W543_9PEZI|nr:hypothetical protein QBC36DRAFT_302800 [Podospora setosa]
MGIGSLLDEIESGGIIRSYRDHEDLAYKKPVTNLAAKEKAEQYHRYCYATGPASCGGHGKPTPLIHPENWVYAPGDTPRPSAIKTTISSTYSNRHRRGTDVVLQTDTANEAVTVVEHGNGKAVGAKANEADNVGDFHHHTPSSWESMNTDEKNADAIKISSRPIKALKKKGDVNSPPKAIQNKPSTSVPAPVVLFPISAQAKATAPTSAKSKPKRKPESLDYRGLKRSRIEIKEKNELVSHSLDDGAATIEARKRAAAVPDTPIKYVEMNLDVQQVQCRRCRETFGSRDEGMAGEGTCSWHSGTFTTNHFTRCTPHGEPHIEERESKYSCCGATTPERPGCRTTIRHTFD